ncbi:MAG: dienelactone hydrolase family protein [Candidatus Binatia bacterium]|jgi:carboxymethylenebutenolidase
MERKKASDFDPELLGLFHRYVHGDINRREFLDGAARFAIGGMTAMGLWEMLRPNYARAQQVPKDDKRIKAEYAFYPSPKGNASDGKMRGLLAQPARGDKFPVVVVFHENRGLTPHIEDIARRLAVSGFMAFAPDAIWPLGGYPLADGAEADEKAAKLFRSIDDGKYIEDCIAAAEFLLKHPQSTGKLGAVGFCNGGAKVNQLAVRLPELAAAVPFYGRAPAVADVPKIKAAVLAHFADEALDPNTTGTWPAYETALKANGIKYEGYIYSKAYHGFHNDTTPRYDTEAAKLAWQRTIDHFNKTLKS